jgi:hypothetical protein
LRVEVAPGDTSPQRLIDIVRELVPPQTGGVTDASREAQ